MAKRFIKELNQVKKRILSLGSLVEERVRMAVTAVENKDAQGAEKIIKYDYEIDEMEVEIEEECLKVLALHQPVAVDLRFLVTVIKINSELERIGDQAVNIAQRVAVLAKQSGPTFEFDYAPMAEKAEAMLRMSLDALVNLDNDLAFKVFRRRLAGATKMSRALWHMLIAADRVGEHRFALDLCQIGRAHV